MNNIFDFFPSNHLKASDLGGQPRQVAIQGFSVETMQDGTQKPTLTLANVPKKLLLNKTNAITLGQGIGPDVDTWPGRQITLFSIPVSFQGKVVDAIRVSIPSASPGPQTSVFDNPTPVATTTPPQPGSAFDSPPTVTPSPQTPTVPVSPAQGNTEPPPDAEINWDL